LGQGTTLSFSQDKKILNSTIHNFSKTNLNKCSNEITHTRNNNQTPPIIQILRLKKGVYGRGFEFDGRYFYTTKNDSTFNYEGNSEIITIDPQNGELIKSHKWPKSVLTSGIAWDGRYFYFSDCRSQKIGVADAQFDFVRIMRAPFSESGRIAFDGENLVVTSFDPNRIWILNSQDCSIIKDFESPIDETITGLACDGNYIWISGERFIDNDEESFIYKIDRNGNIIEQFKSPGRGPCSGLVFDGQYLWLGHTWQAALYKIDIGNSSSPEIKDSDTDGVIDIWDKCPDTPENSCVNKQGCSCDNSLIDEKGSVEKSKWKTYYVNIDETYSNFTVKLIDITDDVDLYVKKGSKPDFNNYDCRPYKGSKRDELCDLSNSGNNLWYFCVYGYKAGEFNISVKAKR